MKLATLASVGSTLDAFFQEISDAWILDGHQVISAASGFASTPNFTELKSVSRRPRIRNIKAPLEIEQWLLANKPDVLITNTATASALARVRAGHVPVIYFCHGLHWDSSAKIHCGVWQILEKRFLRNTAGVIVINSDDEKWFRSKKHCPPLLRLPLGVGVPQERFKFAPKKGFSEPLQLLWAGEFSSRKRPEQAIKVMEQLKTMGVSVHLRMLGRGSLLPKAEQLVTNLGLQNEIDFPGHVPIEKELLDCDAVLHTAAWEGLPRILLEAHAVGRTVFAYDAKGVRDVPHVFLPATASPNGLARLIKETFSAGDLSVHAPHADIDSKVIAEKIIRFSERLLTRTQTEIPEVMPRKSGSIESRG